MKEQVVTEEKLGFLLFLLSVFFWRYFFHFHKILTTNELVWSSLLEYASFARLHICIDWNMQELLKCVSLLTTTSRFRLLF